MSVTLYSRKTWGVCKCGHYDWQHDNSVIVPDEHGGMPQARGEGHGRCNCEGCNCKQFTWVRNEPAHRTQPEPSVVKARREDALLLRKVYRDQAGLPF